MPALCAFFPKNECGKIKLFSTKLATNCKIAQTTIVDLDACEIAKNKYKVPKTPKMKHSTEPLQCTRPGVKVQY